MEVVKFTTHRGEEFYAPADGMNQEGLERIVEANRAERPIRQIEVLEMDQGAYRGLRATSASAAFFSGVGRP